METKSQQSPETCPRGIVLICPWRGWRLTFLPTISVGGTTLLQALVTTFFADIIMLFNTSVMLLVYIYTQNRLLPYHHTARRYHICSLCSLLFQHKGRYSQQAFLHSALCWNLQGPLLQNNTWKYILHFKVARLGLYHLPNPGLGSYAAHQKAESSCRIPIPVGGKPAGHQDGHACTQPQNSSHFTE